MQGLWERKISDFGHGNFFRILPHVASKTSAHIGYVNRIRSGHREVSDTC
jgi:hypothetical protein